jgi:Multiubiquitin
VTEALESPPPPSLEHGMFYTLFVDDREFQISQPSITGAEIMDLAGIPREAGLLLIDNDGTQQQIRAEDVIELKPGRRFKKAPRFKRG